jgi:hypothetical protein
MPDRATTGREKKLIALAVLIIVIGVGVGILHRLDMVSVWVSLVSTLVMGISVLYLAISAARAGRNGADG